MAARNLPSSCPTTDRDGACEVAERIRKAVMDLRIAHGAPGAGAHVTLSVGVATLVPGNDVGPDWLLGQADQALYAAKRLGRNRVVCADTMLADFARLASARKTAAQNKTLHRARSAGSTRLAGRIIVTTRFIALSAAGLERRYLPERRLIAWCRRRL